MFADSVEDSIIKNHELLEAKCRYCGEYQSNRASRSNHEAKEHTDEEKQYDDRYRHPEKGTVYSKEGYRKMKN